MLSVAAVVNAQQVGLAMQLMDNDYFGSARSAALGNAMTALGGDMGSMQINPAGTAVAKYSQATISPVLGISTIASAYYQYGTDEYWTGKNTRVSSMAPNVGISLNINTGNRVFKNVSLGFSMQSTMFDRTQASVGGINDNSSFTGALACESNGYQDWELASYYDDVYWPYGLGYRTGMTRNVSETEYLGAAEVYSENGGRVRYGGEKYQDYWRSVNGTKQDFIINVSTSLWNKLYLGANLNIPVLSYSGAWRQEETAVNPGDFEYKFNGETVHFRGAGMTSYEGYYGSGINAKFGFLLVPVKWFRLGGAIQTSTVFNMRRIFRWDGYCDYDLWSEDDSTPEGQETYRLTNPMRYNLGAAFVIGKYCVISCDWEEANYGNMRYGAPDGSYDRNWDYLNQDVMDYAGKSRTVRAGLEVKPIESVAIRCGYSRTARAYDKEDDVTSILSFGLGYSSNGSFYVDFVTRIANRFTEYWYPYNDYAYDLGSPVYYSPEITFKKSSVDMMLTFGFRF